MSYSSVQARLQHGRDQFVLKALDVHLEHKEVLSTYKPVSVLLTLYVRS